MTNSRRKRKQKRNGRICISLIAIMFLVIMSVQIVKLYQKEQEYTARENVRISWIITKNIPRVRNILKTRQRASWD